jgi:hypothetical protein
MDTSVVITVVVGLIVVAVTAFQVQQRRYGVDSPRTALDAFYEVRSLVETYAPAADQLFAIGAIPKEERLPYVLRMVMKFVTELDEATVRGIIEGFLAEQKRQDSGESKNPSIDTVFALRR